MLKRKSLDPLLATSYLFYSSQRLKNKLFAMTENIQYDIPYASCLPDLISCIGFSCVSQPHWPPCCSLKIWDIIPLQDLEICYIFCLNHSSIRLLLVPENVHSITQLSFSQWGIYYEPIQNYYNPTLISLFPSWDLFLLICITLIHYICTYFPSCQLPRI